VGGSMKRVIIEFQDDALFDLVMRCFKLEATGGDIVLSAQDYFKKNVKRYITTITTRNKNKV
jgi:hypothetical protein